MTQPVSFFRRVTILLELYRENWQGGNIYEVAPMKLFKIRPEYKQELTEQAKSLITERDATRSQDPKGKISKTQEI